MTRAMARIILFVLAPILASIAAPQAQADLSTYLKLENQKAPRGMESIPNHPRACAEGDTCFHNADPDATFQDWAVALATDDPNVTAEDIIRYSGWEPYVNDKVLLMDEMFYAYSTGPTSAVLNATEQSQANNQEPESVESLEKDESANRPWWKFWD